MTTATRRQAETPTVPAPRPSTLPVESGSVSLVLSLARFGTFECYLGGLGVSRMALRAPRAVTL